MFKFCSTVSIYSSRWKFVDLQSILGSGLQSIWFITNGFVSKSHSQEHMSHDLGMYIIIYHYMYIMLLNVYNNADCEYSWYM